ncbi:MAG: hypothetical protein VKL20_01085 [Synechocystis sp.]|nr:hypothetical protein [Synechocystis sp.]
MKRLNLNDNDREILGKRGVASAAQWGNPVGKITEVDGDDGRELGERFL